MPPTKIMLKYLNVMIPLVIISFIYSSNISGQSTVPCSTPWPGKTETKLDYSLSSTTHWERQAEQTRFGSNYKYYQ